MVEINTYVELTDWLKDKPPEWPQMLAIRTALRTVPFLSGKKFRSRIVLNTFRALIVSWTACVMRASDLRDVARAAAKGSAYAAGDSSVDVMNSACAAADAVAKAPDIDALIDAVENTLSAARDSSGHLVPHSDAWVFLCLDIDWLIGNSAKAAELLRTPLWKQRDIPTVYLKDVQNELLRVDPNWKALLTWYNLRVEGSYSAFDLLPDSVDREFLMALANENDRFWRRRSNFVIADIARRLEIYRKGHFLEPATEPYLPGESLLPQQDPKAQTFVQQPDGRIAPAPRDPSRRLLEDESQRMQYANLRRAIADLRALGVNELGARLGLLSAEAEAALPEEIADADPERLWPCCNRLRRVLRKHEAVASSKDYSPDRLDGGVAEDLGEVVESFNIAVIGQPLLADKDKAARGPRDERDETTALARIAPVILVIGNNNAITTAEASPIIQGAVEDATAEGDDVVTRAGREEGKRVSESFLAKCLSSLRWAAEKAGGGTLEGVGSKMGEIMVENREIIVGFVAVAWPLCKDAVSSLLEIASHLL